MGDDRTWQEEGPNREASAPLSLAAEMGAVRSPRAQDEVLRIRWDTPRGRRVRAQLIKDVRFERSAHLAEILSELRGADEVKGFLDLRFVKLDGENLNGTQLAGIDFTGASLAKASLVNADLRNTRFLRARLAAAQLRDADLSRADLSDANLTEATLEGAVMVSTTFARARCIGTSFARASLVNATFKGAMLVRATFDEADMGGADVEGAHAFANVFARTRTGPKGSIHEVPKGGDGTAQPRPRVDVSRLERTSSGAFRAPTFSSSPPAEEAEAAQKSWDFALASLIMRRNRVEKVVITVDGTDVVLFEKRES